MPKILHEETRLFYGTEWRLFDCHIDRGGVDGVDWVMHLEYKNDRVGWGGWMPSALETWPEEMGRPVPAAIRKWLMHRTVEWCPSHQMRIESRMCWCCQTTELDLLV